MPRTGFVCCARSPQSSNNRNTRLVNANTRFRCTGATAPQPLHHALDVAARDVHNPTLPKRRPQITHRLPTVAVHGAESQTPRLDPRRCIFGEKPLQTPRSPSAPRALLAAASTGRPRPPGCEPARRLRARAPHVKRHLPHPRKRGTVLASTHAIVENVRLRARGADANTPAPLSVHPTGCGPSRPVACRG